MSKKRKPNRRRLPREFRRPPNADESVDIAATIYGFAELVADGKPEDAVDAIRSWAGRGAVARLHTHYIAAVTPALIMGLIRKHFPVDMAPDDFWIMQRLPGAEPNVHTDALCQVVVRHLNDDVETAQALLDAHIAAQGEEGLFWFSVEAIKVLAGIIVSAREAEAGDAA